MSLRELKKRLKDEKLRGEAPEWLHHSGYQVLRNKGYLDNDETVRDRFVSIIVALIKHLPEKLQTEYRNRFYGLLWEGKLAMSTPVFSNVGKPYKGCPISCSGGYVDDSIDGFYSANREVALMSKAGFGTSEYVSDVRPRGSSISDGGTAEGVVPVIETLFNTVSKVSQSSSRRGSIATYIDIDHGDFDEIIFWVENNSDGTNIGWNISDDFIGRYFNNEPEAIRRFQEIMYLRMLGKGYLFFIDRANRQNPEVYKKHNLDVKASNLCNEITLHSSTEYSFTCCLSSLNLSKWDQITPEDIQTAVVFLDCVNSEFIEVAKDSPGLEKAVKFAKWSRPIGLGAMGLGTYLQDKMVPFDSLEAKFLNIRIFREIRKNADIANNFLGKILGEPKLMEGTGLRMSHLMAIAPNMTSALIMGGVSNGIEPVFASIYTQETSAGDVRRASPKLHSLLKERGMWTKANIDNCMENEGSVLDLDGLSDEEKAVFKTAFEVSQEAILRMADDRAKEIDQSQSLNLFFNALSTEQEIGDIHRLAMKMNHLKGMYYIRSIDTSSSKIKHNQECVACEG